MHTGYMPSPEKIPDDRESRVALIEMDQGQIAFVMDCVRNPPEPSERLRAAMKQHRAKK